MTQTAKEIVEYLQKRYDINISTKNYLINKIDKAIADAYAEANNSNGCDCGQPSCRYCN